MPRTLDPTALPPLEAVERLLAGNRRFREGGFRSQARGWSPELAAAPQRPFAIVLGCSDSRTPVEILFDEGFGDLFVIRIAGNVVAPSVVGSIEFAASQFGSRLVVVLGHTRCGAISATVEALETGHGPVSGNIRSITERIAPHVEVVVRTGDREPQRGPERREALLRDAMRANVRAAADHLRHGSRVLEDLVLAGRLAVVGAEYDLDTGAVGFLDGVP